MGALLGIKIGALILTAELITPFADIMRSHEIPDVVMTFLEAALQDIYHDQDSASWTPYRLPEPLLTAWAVEQAQGVIDNGGFQYFFENDWPDNPEYAVFIDAFRRIGAVEAADCIQDAVRMFPSSTPHLDCDMRREYMDFLREKEGVEESAIDELGDRVMDIGGDTMIQLASYIQAHLDFFPRVKNNPELGTSQLDDPAFHKGRSL